jgi:adenine-specific DNA-methyltransferase
MGLLWSTANRGKITSDLTKAHDYKQRPNTFYPIEDPNTNIFYPPNPDAVWRYSSRERLKEGQKLETKTMEEFIQLGQILFPKEQRVVIWNTMDELIKAIDEGQVPKSGKSPILRRDLPNLEYWIGKKVGFGRPAFKRYKEDLRNDTQPLSSWIVPTFEEDDYEAETSLISGTNQEGARDVAALFGDKAFNYAKPLSLIQGLIAQATNSNDIVLDFFAGSGTTGHAVLSQNALDGGNRRFILCSSTEATEKEPLKNLCRDVCAVRIRKVIESDRALANNSFAYLQLDKIEAADVAFEATPEHAKTLILMRETASAGVLIASTAIQIIAKGSDWLTVLCPEVTPQTLDELAKLPATHGVARLAVFCPRPKALALLLAERGVEANTYSITDALLKGQVSSKKGAKVAYPDTPSPETTLADGSQGAAA